MEDEKENQSEDKKMKRMYDQDLKELNISKEEYDNIISNICDKSVEEMIVLAKAIRTSKNILPAVKRAFERVLDMSGEEMELAYRIYYAELNRMCLRCKRLGKDCRGTTEKVWDGCVYMEV